MASFGSARDIGSAKVAIARVRGVASAPLLARVLVLVLVAALAPAPARALPQSLRSVEDVTDVAEAFMTALVANQLPEAYRTVARYWPDASARLAGLIAAAEERRKELRKTIGLSLGYEAVRRETAGERVLRLTYLERFDEGGLVWQLVFYRADAAWQLVALTETDDLQTLFGDR